MSGVIDKEEGAMIFGQDNRRGWSYAGFDVASTIYTQ